MYTHVFSFKKIQKFILFANIIVIVNIRVVESKSERMLVRTGRVKPKTKYSDIGGKPMVSNGLRQADGDDHSHHRSQSKRQPSYLYLTQEQGMTNQN